MKEMLPQFGDDFCASCKPIARIWHKGNDPIGRRPIAIIDVHLTEIHAINLVHRKLSFYSVLAVLNVLLLERKW